MEIHLLHVDGGWEDQVQVSGRTGEECLYHIGTQMLSENTSVVSEDRPHIGEATVCAIRTVKDAVEILDPVSNQPQKIPLTRELLRSAKMAYASYRQKLDGDNKEERQLKQQELEKAEKKRLEREREEEDKRTTSLLDKEKELLKKESDIQGKLVTSEELLKDGSSKLIKAVEKGDLKGASVAQMMIATTTSKIEKLRREVDKVRESQKQVEKEKRKLLENKLESKSRS